ncbi:MAG: MFS transporter [Treponema sp.]|nr:MFS transporter [Treponema sp.]
MKSWKVSFTALMIAQLLAISGFGFTNPIIPLFLSEEIGIADPVKLKAWVGAISAISSLMMAVFAPIWGHLADTFSRKAMLLRAMFGGAAVISLMSFVNAPWQLLVLKTIQGCLTGTVTAATVITVGIAPAAQVAFALGLLQTGIAIGNSLGPLIGGFIGDFLGYRANFISTSAVLAIAGLLVLKFVEDSSQPAAKTEKKKKLSIIPDFRPIAGSSILLTMMMVRFGINIALNTISPMLSLFIMELVRGGSADSAFVGSSTGIVLGASAASTAVAAILVGKFSPRLGYRRALILCLTAGCFFIIPQTFVQNVAQLVVLRILSAFFLGGATPVISAIIAISSDKKSQGMIYGLNSSVGSAGNALGPVIGSAAAMISYRAVFMVSAAVLALFSWQLLRRRNTG